MGQDRRPNPRHMGITPATPPRAHPSTSASKRGGTAIEWKRVQPNIHLARTTPNGRHIWVTSHANPIALGTDASEDGKLFRNRIPRHGMRQLQGASTAIANWALPSTSAHHNAITSRRSISTYG